jgi:polyisoprenyl-teichoic acid--peptidoglycan teichoic acid transferase
MTDAIKKHRHSGKQRIFVFFNIALAVVTILAGSGLLYANWKLGNRQVVAIDTTTNSDGDLNLPEGDRTAKNFLITGSDNNACISKDSPFYGGFGKRSAYGSRSDSLMVVRVNPIDNQAAILSFPRDMWVKQAGSTRSNRINANFNKNDPNRLIRTLKENFSINIDHYINVDFCAFAGIVDAVGGVRVPFQYKARDKRTGFKVLRARVCYTFQGDHALAYMRSRHYSWFDPATRNWRTDGTSDYGRISRQQDFMKRVIRKALDKARSNPRVATGIMNAALKNIITDDKLTPLTVLQLGQAMKNFDTETMGSYTMPGTGTMIDQAAVILPDLESSTSKKILSVFQGKASLSSTIKGASTTTVASTTTTTLAVIASTTLPKSSSGSGSSKTTSTTTTTVPKVSIDQDTRGVVPPNDPTCQY